MKLQRYQNKQGNKQFRITVPVKITEFMGWVERDDLKFRINKFGQVVLTKKEIKESQSNTSREVNEIKQEVSQ